MAAGAGISPPFAILEGSYNNNKDNGSTIEDEGLDDVENLKQSTIAKPPRHISVVRHSMSSAALCLSAGLVTLAVFSLVHFEFLQTGSMCCIQCVLLLNFSLE